mgnify:CR=1 FL=1
MLPGWAEWHDCVRGEEALRELPQHSRAQEKALFFLQAGGTLESLPEAERAELGDPWLKAKQRAFRWSGGSTC